MRRRRQRGLADSSLSFLDVISGGFGAIILLVVLAKIGEPLVLEEARRDLAGLVAQLEEELHEIRGETEILNRDMITRQEQMSQEQASLPYGGPPQPKNKNLEKYELRLPL